VTEVFLGVGSNVAAEAHLELALAGLEAQFGSLSVSRVFRNPAVGCVADDFLNLAVRIDTTLPPPALRQALRTIEQGAARDRSSTGSGRWTLDIDLLLYGRRVDAAMKLPRADILRHAYVLCPLAELAPELRHPVTGQALRDAWFQHCAAGAAWIGSGWHLARVAAPGGDGPFGVPAAHPDPVPAAC
jgi:2-amino-4-hydroxy-6-hydroxymethyldihydropteridine diphosphokinase